MKLAKTLSYCDIAYKILKRENKFRSMHYKEIAKRAFESEILDENNVIIASNISSAINSEIRKANFENKESRFISYGKGKYGLTENEPQGIFKEIRDKNNSVKERLLKSLLAMSPFAFEELVGEVLRHLGFENIVVTAKSGDGGIDVMGELVVAGAIKNNVCVQVKRWQNNVQRGSISELRGSLRPHQIGLFITTSDFSSAAIEEASDPYKAPISLINGKEFVEIMCSYGVGVKSEDVTVFDIDEDNDFLKIQNDLDINEDGMEIFCVYKDKTYYAIYFSPTKVVYDNEVFSSPSAAAVKVQGQQVNGWKVWKFIDKTDGKIYPLDTLRN